MLYKQLVYFDHLFNVDKCVNNLTQSNQGRALSVGGTFLTLLCILDFRIRQEKMSMATGRAAAFDELSMAASTILAQNGRQYVDLTTLFSFCRV
jgi:hypothetical protein